MKLKTIRIKNYCRIIIFYIFWNLFCKYNFSSIKSYPMKRIITLLYLVALFNNAYAQYFEVGAIGGVTSYIGDLQPNSPATGSYGLTYGALLRLHYRPQLSFKVSAISGKFYATDRYAKGTRRFRNLEAETQYYELAATAEWNIAQYNVLDNKTTSPYLFAGVAGFYFNPRARTDYTNYEWVNLRSLGTEGQTLDGGKKPYSQFQVAIPFGVGIKMSLSKKLNLGFELGFRQTFTDYLDDVSGNYPDLSKLSEKDPIAAKFSFRTPELFKSSLELPSGLKRGDSYKFDMYFFSGITLTFNLADKSKMEFNERYRNFGNN